MFTGIVEAVGEIKRVTPLEKGVRLDIACGGLDLSDVRVGDSIAVSGVCLTVVGFGAGTFAVDVSGETLNCTQGLERAGGRVNLEKALRLSDWLGGHLVSGHVDGIGEVAKFEPAGESMLLRIQAPKDLAKYVACKGSVTVNGVSLTVNRVEGEMFDINLIPHTLAMTTLKELKPGARLNLEVDLLARYLERMMTFDAKSE